MSRQLIIDIMRFSLAIALMLSLSSSSCGRKYLDIDSSLLEYVERFEGVGGISVDNLVAKFGNLQGPLDGTVGLCETWSDNRTPEITIDTTYWYAVGDLQREELMFHELGHCILGRDHRNDDLSDGCAASIMNEYTISVWCLQNHLDYYRRELFGRP